MRTDVVEGFAELLAGAMASGRPIDGRAVVEAGITLADAYAIQNRVLARLGRPVAGWKVGMATAAARAGTGLDAPTVGPLLRGVVVPSGHRWPPGAFRRPRLEPEIALIMGRDCGADGAPYTAGGVAERVAEVRAAIEVVDSRYLDPETMSQHGVVADLNGAGALVLGERAGLEDLVRAPLRLAHADAEPFEGPGPAERPDPLAIAAGLADHLLRRGAMLRAGEVVTTGACAPAVPATPGRHEVAFGEVWTVSVVFG